MKNPFFQVLFLYLLLLNLGLLVVASNVETDVPFRALSENPDFKPAIFNPDPRRCTIYCETDACTHPKRLMRFYKPVQAQVRWLKQAGTSYEKATLLVYVLILPLLWLVLLYYLLGQPLRQVRSTPAGQLLFWFALTCLVMFSLLFWLVYSPEVLFFDFVVWCLRLAWWLGISLLDAYVVIFVFVLPITTLTLAGVAATKFIYRFLTPGRGKNLAGA